MTKLPPEHHARLQARIDYAESIVVKIQNDAIKRRNDAIKREKEKAWEAYKVGG